MWGWVPNGLKMIRTIWNDKNGDSMCVHFYTLPKCAEKSTYCIWTKFWVQTGPLRAKKNDVGDENLLFFFFFFDALLPTRVPTKAWNVHHLHCAAVSVELYKGCKVCGSVHSAQRHKLQCACCAVEHGSLMMCGYKPCKTALACQTLMDVMESTPPDNLDSLVEQSTDWVF